VRHPPRYREPEPAVVVPAGCGRLDVLRATRQISDLVAQLHELARGVGGVLGEVAAGEVRRCADGLDAIAEQGRRLAPREA
jgi:hypothetical protein